jgi:hypothetical protein
MTTLPHINPERFAELWAGRTPSPDDEMRHLMTEVEKLEVQIRWEDLTHDSADACWMDAFFSLWKEADREGFWREVYVPPEEHDGLESRPHGAVCPYEAGSKEAEVWQEGFQAGVGESRMQRCSE